MNTDGAGPIVGSSSDLLIDIRMILFSTDGRIWLNRNACGHAELPRIQIVKRTRVVPQVVQGCRDLLNLDVFLLWTIEDRNETYAVAELRDDAGVNTDLWPVTPDRLGESRLPTESESVLCSAYAEAFEAVERNNCEPFKRIGWIDKLQSRLRNLFPNERRRVTGAITQINAGSAFSLLKIETTTTPVWFKAAGVPNCEEAKITIALSELVPGFVPEVIACLPEWNAWIAEDTGGQRLDELGDFERWKASAICLADLQVASIDHVETLLTLGCKDARKAVLLARIDGFKAVALEAMKSRDRSKSARLDEPEIAQVARTLEEAIMELGASGIPDTLVHRDLTGGNICSLPGNCRFLDWAQACIGQPFICAEYLQEAMNLQMRSKDRPLFTAEEIAKAYSSRWTAILTSGQLETARLWSPLLAKFLCILPLDGRPLSCLLSSLEHRRFLRSMIRLMWSDVQKLASVVEGTQVI